MERIEIIPRAEKESPNFLYRVGFDVDYAIYVKKGKEEMIFINKMNKSYLKEKLRRVRKRIKVIEMEKFFDFIKKAKGKGKAEIFLDYEGASVRLYKKLEDLGIEVKDLAEEIRLRRMRKRKEELEKIRKAVEITREILNEVEISKGESEGEVLKKIKRLVLEKGVDFSFKPIVAELRNARFPHYGGEYHKTKIKEGVLIDIGVKYKGYCSDLSRVMFLNKSKHIEKYEKLKDIFYSILDESPSNSKELAVLARKMYKKYGIKEPPHLIGHGIGLEVHELPPLSEKVEYNLKGSVLAIEPAFYSKVGLRFEENVYFSKKMKLI